MCTIGAVRLENGAIALFKNKDFALPTFSDQVVFNQQMFGCAGLETFAECDASEPVFSGLSIGANKQGLLVAVNHVKISDSTHRNYDLLTETALRAAADVLQGIELIRAEVSARPYWWGNLILADKSSFAIVEVRGQELQVQISKNNVFRTNHQPMFGEVASPDKLPCSAQRYTSTLARLEAVSNLKGLKAMLSSHDDGNTGICNHGQPLTTVYSYILCHHLGRTTAYIANGLPCKSKWVELNLPFGASWTSDKANAVLQAYPNAAA